MKKTILIISCLVLSVMSLFVFTASLGSLFSDEKDLGVAIPLLLVSILAFFIVFLIAKNHIFDRKDNKASSQNKSDSFSGDSEKLYSYEDIVRGEVMASNYINPIFKEKVIEFQLSLKKYDRINDKDIDFCNEDKLLSAYEKQELGLDVSKEYQRALFLVLTESAPDYGKKRSQRALVLASYKARFIDRMQDDIIKANKLKLTYMKISLAGDGRDCDWCLSTKDQIIPVSLDFVNDVLSNCRCEYPRMLVMPQINF